MEEERRLAFVAMTRARDGLYLTEAEGRGHEARRAIPSRFLLDIDPAALEFSNKPAERELDDARAQPTRSPTGGSPTSSATRASRWATA